MLHMHLNLVENSLLLNPLTLLNLKSGLIARGVGERSPGLNAVCIGSPFRIQFKINLPVFLWLYNQRTISQLQLYQWTGLLCFCRHECSCVWPAGPDPGLGPSWHSQGPCVSVRTAATGMVLHPCEMIFVQAAVMSDHLGRSQTSWCSLSYFWQQNILA